MIIVASLSAGGLLGYWIGYTATSAQVSRLQDQLSIIQEQINNLQAKSETTSQNQSDILETIDALQSQLSEIRDQINSLQASSVDSQNIDEVMEEINGLRSQLLALQEQIDSIKALPSITYILGENVSLSQLFEQVRESVVVIQAIRSTVTVQGSGFVYNYSGQMIILTNNHVIKNAISIRVTFSNGHTYTASCKGSNQTTDVAVLTTPSAPQAEYKPLEIVSSSTLKVGDPVIVVGTPYGLEGSMSNGIISALNRTINTGETILTNIIQTTAPLNPGNSGGPLMNYLGQVVGMATAIVEDSQGIGFAIPSDTILQNIREIMG